ncbi:MAG: XdhC family protein [Ignavibacteria bacterium]|nr:XdhC family protein [Ignavibacteria bacterium]
MSGLQIWNFTLRELSENKNVILYSVVSHTKGSPGKTGFRMAVSEAGNYTGSVGGGIMEFELIKNSRELFHIGEEINTIENLIHYKHKIHSATDLPARESGLICSGSQIISANLITDKDLHTVQKITKSFEKWKKICVSTGSNGLKIRTTGNFENERYTFRFSGMKDWQFTENTGLRDTILIAGAGHVGIALYYLLSTLDFNIILFDDRKGLKVDFKKFISSKLITRTFSEVGKCALKYNVNYAVIVTTKFESDKQALIQLLSKDLKYLGLMGTKAKIKKIFSDAVKEGVDKNLIRRVKAPVGIEINSNTPEEIAVSIAAEIIKTRNLSE